MRKPLYGVGINDADYPVYKTELVGFNTKGRPVRRSVWKCPYYAAWAGMIRRAYSREFPTYLSVSVVEDWKLFSNFKAWMEVQDWEGKELDKDIIQREGNVYSENTCAFVPRYLNMVLVGCKEKQGIYPLGVSFRQPTNQMVGAYMKPYQAACGGNKSKYIGTYFTVEEAHKAWQETKVLQILNSLSRYKKESSYNPKVEAGLLHRCELLSADILAGQETHSL